MSVVDADLALEERLVTDTSRPLQHRSDANLAYELGKAHKAVWDAEGTITDILTEHKIRRRERQEAL